MATWYYARDGAIIGPFSEEAVVKLIYNGTVTFVTMVWDSDTKNEGDGWLYAYDTPLFSYFSEDSQEDKATESLARTEQVEPRSRQSAGRGKEPRKPSLPVVIFLVLFIIGHIIGLTYWYLRNS